MYELAELARRGGIAPLLKRLTVYAWRHMHSLTWRGATLARGGNPPEGYGPQDFAAAAIRKALDGTRVWNREVYPTVELFLCSIIKSDVNHLAESLDNTCGRPLVACDGEFQQPHEPSGNEPDPLAVVMDREWRERYRAAVWRELDGDRLLVDLLRCYEAAVTKPSEIARRLGRPVEEIYDGLKRFRRKLERADDAVSETNNDSRRTGK